MCGFVFPCPIVLQGMGFLHRRGWELPEVIDLIETAQGGERQTPWAASWPKQMTTVFNVS